jgi:hypothetical protein
MKFATRGKVLQLLLCSPNYSLLCVGAKCQTALSAIRRQPTWLQRNSKLSKTGTYTMFAFVHLVTLLLAASGTARVKRQQQQQQQMGSEQTNENNLLETSPAKGRSSPPSLITSNHFLGCAVGYISLFTKCLLGFGRSSLIDRMSPLEGQFFPVSWSFSDLGIFRQ